MNTAANEAEVKSIGWAVRCGFVAVVLGVSCPNMFLALGLDRFAAIYNDMLNGKPLPAMTDLVLHSQPLLIGVSILIPAVAVGLLWLTPLSRSLWMLVAVIAAMFAQLCFTATAVFLPLQYILTSIGQGA